MIGQPLSELKRANSLLWSVDVGRMHSRNNVVVRGDCAFLSSSGEEWNAPDRKDGVYCIDLRSESIVWFVGTHSDANEISLIGNILLVGTDKGETFAIDADAGRVLSKINMEEPVYTRAIELEMMQGRVGILISYSGRVIQYDLSKNDFSVIGQLPYLIRANPTKISAKSFLVGSETGVVALVEVGQEHIRCERVFEVQPHKSSGTFDYYLQIRGISSILSIGDRVVVSYSRDTYDRRPPVLCFSLKTGKKIWDAGRVQTASKVDVPEFGNSRVMPAIWDNLLISTFSYNDGVHAFSLETGKWVWRQRLDDSYFQNWSSPVVSDGLLYVARVNGVLSVLDLKTRKVLSSYSVEVFDFSTNELSGIDHEGKTWPISRLDFESAGPHPKQKIVAGICSTPVIWRGMILIGTVSGKFYCLREQTPVAAALTVG